ncbi:MAG: TonB-dependent receptor plug domain-containing protein [Clostridia bacterium]|nr:TonB-dependent receptor plug domain-containing protein [Deltaproteobacteria bacterium]
MSFSALVAHAQTPAGTTKTPQEPIDFAPNDYITPADVTPKNITSVDIAPDDMTPEDTAPEDTAPKDTAPEDIATWDLANLLEETVVTGTGDAQSRAITPAKITTWNHDEILRHGWTTLAEILAYTPGMYVIDDGVIPSVGVRGTSGGLRSGTRIIRVMVNGTEVSFKSDLTAFLGPEFLPIEVIDRVEIAKGPLSALYGANAFLATVNVITKRPVDGLRGDVAASMQLINGHVGYGGSGYFGYATDQVDAMFAYSQRRTDRSGYDLRRTFPAQDDSVANYRGFFDNPSRNDISRPQSLYGSARGNFGSGGVLTAQGGRQVVDSQGEFQPGSVLTHDSRIALANNWASLNYRLERDAYIMTLDLSGSIGKPTRNEQLSVSDELNFYYRRNFGYHAITASGSIEIPLPATMRLRGGVEYNYDDEDILYFSQIYRVPLFDRPVGYVRDRIRSDVDRSRTITNVAGYLQLNGHPVSTLPDLYVFANGRIDLPNLFDTQFSWRAGAAYGFSPRFISKLFLGRAFQIPSAVQLFARPGFGEDSNIVGNRTLPSLPMLEPQSIVSAELANSFGFSDNVFIEQSFYYQELRDKIELTRIAGNYSARNLDTARTLGADVELRVQTSRFRGFANLAGQAQTYVNGQGERHFAVVSQQEFPTYTASLGVSGYLQEIYTIADITTMVVGARASSQSNTLLNDNVRYQLPAYCTVNATFNSTGINIVPKLGETHLLASVTNILDTRYSQPGHGGFDIANQGRRFFFRLAQKF